MEQSTVLNDLPELSSYAYMYIAVGSRSMCMSVAGTLTLRACRFSSSWQVSTTKRKMVGAVAER